MCEQQRVAASALLVNMASALTLALALELTSASVAAAQTSAGSGARTMGGVPPQSRQTYRVVTNSIPCGEDQTEFMTVGRLPEGLALLRMRDELEAVGRLQSLAATNRVVRNGPRVSNMQREVDSLTRVVRSIVLAAPRRGDAVESEMEQRRAVTQRVRALAPQVDQAVEYELARIARPASSAPAGYMGVTVSSVPLRQSLQDGYIVSYCEYPLVVAIDPGSPAERSGLQAGDTIVAFNGQDVRRGMVDYSALLTPNTTVRVRALRDGRTRDFAVRVATRPSPTPVRMFARTPASSVATAIDVSVSGQLFVFERPMPSALRGASGEMTTLSDSVRVVTFARGDPGFPPSVAVPARGSTPPAPPALLSLFANRDDSMLFGAQLKSLGNDLRVALSLPEGVLVLQVLRGTPAADAGLRDGDVIRAVDGRAVRAVADIRDAFDRAFGARSLALRVARKNEAERMIVLLW